MDLIYVLKGTKLIIYIHGFGSSGQSGKAKIFKKYFDAMDERFIAITLSYVPTLAIETLEQIIDLYDGDIYLIGSSLGGYYSTYLATKNKVKKVVLINPSINPQITLHKVLGNARNYYDESYFQWTQNHLDMLKCYKLENSNIDSEKFLLMVQKGDKTLDYKEAVDKYKNSRMIIEEGGNHSFENIENHLDYVKKFLFTFSH